MQVPARHAEGVSRIALLFALISAAMLSFSAAVCWGLARTFGKTSASGELLFPWAFGISTLLLALGSATLHRAWRAVRLERQRRFRNGLGLALLWGGLFMGVQTYGLWTLFPDEREASSASLGVTAFVLTLAALHGLHFFVTTLFVCFVAARSAANRYDHEYHWGVTVCLWLWHALGIVWLAILAIFAIAL